MTQNQFEKNPEQKITIGASDIAPAPSEAVEEIKKTRKKRVNRIKDLEAIDWKQEMEKQQLIDQETEQLKARMAENAQIKEEKGEETIKIEKEEAKKELNTWQFAKKVVNSFFRIQTSEEGKDVKNTDRTQKIMDKLMGGSLGGNLAQKTEKKEVVKNAPAVESIPKKEKVVKIKNGMVFYDTKPYEMKKNSEGKYDPQYHNWEVKHQLKKGGETDYLILKQGTSETKIISAAELVEKIKAEKFKLKS